MKRLLVSHKHGMEQFCVDFRSVLDNAINVVKLCPFRLHWSFHMVNLSIRVKNCDDVDEGQNRS